MRSAMSASRRSRLLTCVARHQFHLHLGQGQAHLRQHRRQHEAGHRLAGRDAHGAGDACLRAATALRTSWCAGLPWRARSRPGAAPSRWAAGRARCARTARRPAGFPARRCGGPASAGSSPAPAPRPAGCRGPARPGRSGPGSSRSCYSFLNICYEELGNCGISPAFPQWSHRHRSGARHVPLIHSRHGPPPVPARRRRRRHRWPPRRCRWPAVPTPTRPRRCRPGRGRPATKATCAAGCSRTPSSRRIRTTCSRGWWTCAPRARSCCTATSRACCRKPTRSRARS